MTAKLALRIASVIILLHAAGHTVGVYTWKDQDGSVPLEVIKPMVEVGFTFQDTPATMGKFYEGMGYASTISLLLVAVLLWIVGDAATSHSKLSIRILVTLTFFLFLLGIDEVIYFFPMAAAFSFVSMVLCVFAIGKLSKVKN